MEFRELVKKEIEKRNMSPTKLAKIIGTNNGRVIKYLQGRGDLENKTKVKIAKFLGIPEELVLTDYPEYKEFIKKLNRLPRKRTKSLLRVLVKEI